MIKHANLTTAEISTMMEHESPVFIVGAPRSGSSILYRSLQGHSKFKIKGKGGFDVDLTESKVFNLPYSTYSQTDRIAQAYLLGQEKYWEQFQALTQKIQHRQKIFPGKSFYQKIARRIQLDKELRKKIWRGLENDTLLRVYFYFAQQARGVERIVEKTPDHVFRIPEIEATFPKAKLLFIHRHPIQVFSSYRRRFQSSIKRNLYQSNLQWLKVSPSSFCDFYKRSIKRALEEGSSDSSKMLLIKYENFTNNPNDTLHYIFNFLNESYEEECVCSKKELDLRSEANLKGAQLDPKLLDAIDNESKDWANYMDKAEAKFIENQLSKVMSQLNYQKLA